MKNFSILWVSMAFLWLFVMGKASAQTINSVEYFIDNDPGVGNGTAVSITTGNVVTQTFPVSLSSINLKDGIHRISVRAKDSNNQWSWVANSLFVKERITNTAPPIDITKIEYFFNLDPGVGNGVDVPFTQGTSVSNLGFVTPLPSLPIGFHYLSVRVKDARNGWTRCISRPFLKEEIPSNIPLPNITYMEYFLDEDPGVSNGTALTFTPATSISNLSFTIPLPDNVSPGIHTFSVRAKNANNKWSIVTNRAFLKENIQSSIPLSAISNLEYFFDNDPGVGNGTAVNFTAGTTVNDLSFSVPLSNSLPNGIHTVTVRFKDNKGKWSTAVVRPFYKENTSTLAILPNINRVEYFIDTDPGFGNGINVPITPNSSLSNISFTADLTGLQNGKHLLEIRARDINNKWSTVGLREFVSCMNPFAVAISPAAEQNTCVGVPINLSVPTGYTYQWRLNGQDIFNASSNTYSATQTGNYSVVIAQNGCLFTLNSVKVNVTNTPNPPTVITQNQTICNGQKVTLESSNCGGLVTWSDGSTGGAVIVAPTTTTTYTATCTIGGCTSGNSSSSAIITVNAALAIPTITGPNSVVCPNSNVSLSANGCAGVITWNNGQTGSSLNFIATASGTYSATCASGGCVSVASNTFSVNVSNTTSNAMTLTALNAKICNGQSTSLTASGCGGNILWSNGSTTSTITVSPSVTGTYSATCTDNGCTGNSVNILQIQVVPIPNAPTLYGQSQIICKGTSISLSAYNCIGGVINWSNGFVGQTQRITPMTTTTYTATCTKDGCPSANSSGITLTVSECENLAVNITKIEYFIDNDPGFNNGIDVPITASSAINDLNIIIPIQASFADGLHNLSIRAKDANDHWAWTIVRPFWKEALPSINVLPDIVKLEYFIDNDPGYENGTNIPITAGVSINNLVVTMPLDNSLVTGWHNLTIRAKDANGGWSIVVIRPFYKDILPSNANLPNITRLEYYIDTDPGYDLGTEIPISTNSTLSNTPLIINMTGLTPGSHFLAIRAKDVDNKWSTVGIKNFTYGTNIVSIGAIPSDLCGQTNLILPYTLEGTFNEENTLTVQLLDANNNIVNANLLTKNATKSGILTVTLPNVSVNTIYKFRIISSSPSLMSDPVQFTLKPSTIPSISAGGSTTFCLGNSVLLSVSNCNGTVIWSNGITNDMISVTTSGTYSATCNTPNTCSMPTNNAIIVTVYGESSPVITDTSVCGINSTATLTASGCTGGNFAWYLTSTGGTSQFVGNPYTTPQLGSTSTFYVSCVVNGCESTRTPVTVTVNIPPVASITGTTNLTCTNLSVSRTASGGGSYLWSNNLGTSATATITSAGTYTVTVTSLTNGCSATATTFVSVDRTAPVASITGTTNLTCTNLSVSRTASGGGSYLWSNNLGTSATATITSAGTYTVTVSSLTNGCSATATTFVSVDRTAPVASITGTTNLTCTNLSVSRTASGGGSYLWSNNLGTSATATITSAGTYTVTVTSLTNGCSATATTFVSVDRTAPVASITGTTNLTCTNLSVSRTASGGGSYLWSNNLGTSATATITSAGTYTVTVSSLTNGCSATATTFVSVDRTAPVASITGTTNLTCTNLSVSRTASGGGSYLWSNNLGTSATATITSAGTYTVTVSSLTNGCSATATTFVSVDRTAPVASITGTTNLTCTNLSVSRTASGGGSYLWSNNLGTSATATITSAGTYTVTVTSLTNGCSATATTFVSVDRTAPVASITGTTNLTCTNLSVSRTASGGGSYLWSNNLGTSATATITSAGTYTVTVSSLTNGCSATATTFVSVDRTAPVASITGTTNLTCTNLSVSRTASGGGSYLWSNNLGTSATATITSAGTYTVTVSSLTNGCSATATTFVSVDRTAPVASITGTTNLTCTNLSVSRTASGGGSYLWSNNLGTSATATITSAGTYTVTVSSLTNGCSATATTFVSVDRTAPVASITGTTNLTCTNLSVSRTASGGGSYLWSNNLGTSATATITSAGTYTVTVSSLTNGCSATATTFVSVDRTAPVASITGTTNLTCTNLSVSRTASGGGSYLWSNNLGTSATATITSAGTYTVTVSSLTNGCSATATTFVSVDRTAPVASITGTTNLTCTNLSVSRTASGGGSYLWSNNLGTSATATITSAGTYTVTVSSLTNGCSATATTFVSVDRTAPVASITGTTNLTCTNLSVSRTASGGGSYLWSNNLGTSATATITSAGTYTVTVSSLTNGCSATATTFVSVDRTAPVASITGTTNLTCTNLSVSRTASGGGSYLWSNNLGTSATATITSAGTYTVTVSSLTNGCSATATTFVSVDRTAPVASITGTTNLTCTNLSVSRTASGGGSYLWSNNLGTSATATITSAGTYTVTVSSLTNGCSATATTFVSVDRTAPVASITGTTNLTCTNLSVSRTASGGGSYLWSNNLGTSATATITSAGTYTVTVSSLTNGCSATATTFVSVEALPPTPIISPINPPAICSGQSISLTASGCSGLVTWSNGATGSTISVSPTGTTTFTANCTINGCVSNNSQPTVVTITANCNNSIKISPSKVFVCPNTQLTLTATGCSSMITWTGGITGNVLTITPTVTGSYTATCSAGGSSTVVVTVGTTSAILTNADNVSTGSVKFQVTESITSNSIIGETSVIPKPNVLYQAGKSIIMQPGFSITAGSVFNAKIQGCN
ncbi:beta strand repeat-containing protein [Emticicia sp. SJ17W-69]|uniref:beta strand repeat-containing protein n=1 Tax=Emticicia sp. SJ17W-69 TaxID=3421657 RepID=UPI003EB81A6D